MARTRWRSSNTVRRRTTGLTTPEVDVGDSFAPEVFEASIDGLENGSTVHYRIVARNTIDTTEGDDRTLDVPEERILLAHYTFDEEEPFDEEGGFDGIADGDATFAGEGSGADGEGGAFRFGGQGHVVIPLDINPKVVPDLTVTMWVKPDAGIVNAPGLYKTFGHDDGGWDRTFGLDNRGGEFRYAAFTGGLRPEPTPATATPISAQWTFLAAVWDTDEDGLASVRLHADGNFVDEPITNTFSGFFEASIGNLRPDNFNEGWVGLIDEVQIYEAALTVDEIEEIRSQIDPLQPAPPLGETLAAGGLGAGTAFLRGFVTPNGSATTAWFEYGETDALGQSTPEVDFGDGFASVIAEAPLEGLALETEYQFRLVARSDLGTSEGEILTFRTTDELGRLVYYSFDDGKPIDDSGNGNDGTAEGDAMQPLDAKSGHDGDGESFQFFGAGHVVVPVDINPAVHPNLTVTMWVKPDKFLPDTPGLYKTFGHDDGGWDRTFGLDNRDQGIDPDVGDGGYRYAAFTGGLRPGPTGSTFTEIVPEWTFLAAVWTTDEKLGPMVRFHAGEDFVEEPINNTPGFRTAAVGSLRPDNFNEGWQGFIDEVQIFGSALTVEQIEAIRKGDEIEPPDEDLFVRGDADGSGAINITDGIFVLNFLFLGGPDPGCAFAADADDSGTINITDGIFILNFLFLGGPEPPTPHPECGTDPTANQGEGLDCLMPHAGC